MVATQFSGLIEMEPSEESRFSDDSECSELPPLEPWEVTSPAEKLLEEQMQRIAQGLLELNSQVRASVQVGEEMTSLMIGLRSALQPPLPLPVPVDDYDFMLSLVEFPRPPIYVKVSFNISFKLVPKRSLSESTCFPLKCILSARTMDVESKEISKTRASKPFLRGMQDYVFKKGPVMMFKWVYFEDVSSIYPQGRVNLRIDCPECPRVKQLLIEGIRVKAKKRSPDELF